MAESYCLFLLLKILGGTSYRPLKKHGVQQVLRMGMILSLVREDFPFLRIHYENDHRARR